MTRKLVSYGQSSSYRCTYRSLPRFFSAMVLHQNSFTLLLIFDSFRGSSKVFLWATSKCSNITALIAKILSVCSFIHLRCCFTDAPPLSRTVNFTACISQNKALVSGTHTVQTVVHVVIIYNRLSFRDIAWLALFSVLLHPKYPKFFYWLEEIPVYASMYCHFC